MFVSLKKFSRQLPLLSIAPLFLLATVPSFFDASGTFNLQRPKSVKRHNAISAQHHVKQADVNDCYRVPCVALTFDDGPNAQTTPQILDELKQAQVHASFFVIGMHVPGNEALLQRMHKEGHEIGSHSWSHPDLTKLPPDQIRQQVAMTQQAIASAGVPAPTLFRPPYGTINATVQQNVPMSITLWNEDPKDWAAHTPAEVIAGIEASARPGAVVDIHDIYHVTADALPQILNDLKARGIHFVTVSQLLNLNPTSRGVYYGHPKS